MNIRQAILRAAEHIERNPLAFDWWAIATPDCGTPGCALGWIGHFGGAEIGSCVTPHVSIDILGCANGTDFYNKMSKASGDEAWILSSAGCASALRAYADKYHPAENFARDLAARLAVCPRIAEDA